MSAGASIGAVGNNGPRRKHSSKIVEKLEKIEHGLKQKEPEKIPWIKTPVADTFFGVVILLNAAFIGVELEMAPDGFSLAFWIVETVFLVIFMIELIFRFAAECPKPWQFFFVGCEPQWWGIFDFLVTILGCADAWIVTPILQSGSDSNNSTMSSITVLRVFRLMRLARLIRVLRMFNELVVLVQTLGNSIRAVGWMSLLLSMIIYTGSVICVILIGESNDNDGEVNFYFGSLGDALFAHFCVVTLEGWPDIARAAMKHSSLWAFYFVAMITLTNFALVNLMVGVIVERIIHFSTEQETELSAFVAESEQFRLTLQTLFDQADIDANGIVTRQEIRMLMENHKTHEIMTAFGINLDIPPATLYTIMDLNRDGPTTFEEFFNACMRLCGSKQSIHSIFVQHDICECHHDLQERLINLELHVRQAPPARLPVKASAAHSIGNGPNDVQQEYLSPEECITELLERMDRFGQVQLQLCAEMEGLKEQAKILNGPGASRPVGGAKDIRQNRPKEVNGCCTVDSLFSKRKESIPSTSPRVRSPDKNLSKMARKELEAEFRKTKA
jgi:voltage-gated sodium channel